MKKALAVLLSVLILIPHCGCTLRQMQTSVTFYYQIKYDSKNAPTSGISSEQRECADIRNDQIKQLQRYLSGPEDPDLVSPFPAGTTIKSLNFGKGRAYITLSDHITQLHGVSLNIACACLVRTVEEMLGVNSVELRAESGMIDNEAFLILRSSDYEFTDEYADYISSRPTTPQ